MKRTFALVPALLLLAACSTPQTAPPRAAETSPESTTEATADPNSRAARTGQQIGQAVTSPLSDLNIVRADIPAPLQAALKGPYALPAEPGCVGLGKEIEALDAVLGADLDTPQTGANPSLLERGTTAANTAAVGALRGAAEGVVPFRSWVRRLSGAERYSREVAAAIAAGGVRRSFLKGLGQASGCSAPAAPRR